MSARDDELPGQLRRLIDSSGETAYGLGKRSGVSKQQIQRFSAGKRDILLGTAGAIAAALGVEALKVGRKRRPRG